MLTAQEIFTKVVTHLRQQGRQAMQGRDPVSEENVGLCMYRTHDGLMCAVGCLIRPEYYDHEFEGMSVGGRVDTNDCLLRYQALANALHSSGIDMGEHMRLLIMLQDIHDNGSSDHWEEKFGRLADEFGLELP